MMGKIKFMFQTTNQKTSETFFELAVDGLGFFSSLPLFLLFRLFRAAQRFSGRHFGRWICTFGNSTQIIDLILAEERIRKIRPFDALHLSWCGIKKNCAGYGLRIADIRDPSHSRFSETNQLNSFQFPSFSHIWTYPAK